MGFIAFAIIIGIGKGLIFKVFCGFLACDSLRSVALAGSMAGWCLIAVYFPHALFPS
jgi:hypothetical protein